MPVTTLPGRGRRVKTDPLDDPAHRRSAPLTKLAAHREPTGPSQPGLGSGRTRRRLASGCSAHNGTIGAVAVWPKPSERPTISAAMRAVLAGFSRRWPHGRSRYSLAGRSAGRMFMQPCSCREHTRLPRSACLCWWWDGCMVPERSVAACSRQDTCQPSPVGAGKLHHQVGVVNAASLSMRPAMSSWTATAGRAPSTVNIHSRPA